MWEKDGYQGYALLITGILFYARGFRRPGGAGGSALPYTEQILLRGIAGSTPVHRQDGSQTVRRRRDRHVRGSIPLSHSELRSHLGISSAGRAADWRLELSASLETK